MSHHRKKDLFWPILLICLGFLFLFQNLGYIDAGEIISDYWPVLLIIWGISIILNRYEHIIPEEVSRDHGKETDVTLSQDKISFSKTFGDLKIKANSQNFQGGVVDNHFGEIYLDLQGIALAEGENTLFVNGVFGDIRVTLPPNLTSKIECSVTTGSINIFEDKVDGFSKHLIKKTKDYDAASRKLRLVVNLTFGDIVIR